MKKRILSVLLLTGILMIMLSINVFAEDSHTHCICGASHTSVGDHTDEASVVWTEWDGKSSIVTDEAYLYLSSDVVLDSPLTVGDGTKLYLCLHGYDITLNSGVAGSVITVQSGGILNLCDCVGTGKVIGINERTASAPGGAVYILSGGRFNLYSGIITDSIVTNKYGDLDVYNCGTFNMYGGTVTGNNCAQYKNTSNKWVAIHSYDSGTFNMYGGKSSGLWGGIVWSFELDQSGNGKITFEPVEEGITLQNRWANHYYKLNSTDTVPTAYQRGEMPACVVQACNAYYMPWGDHRTKIKQVEIKEGVKSIRSFAFDQISNIGGELVIPKTVEYIGHQAFAKCQFTKITFEVDEITKQTNLHCIAQGCFSGATITELVLPEGLRDLHGSAFGSCKSLNQVHLPSSVTMMGGWNKHLDYDWSEGTDGYTIFPYCTALKKITFADEAIRDRFIYNAASYSICSSGGYDQKVHIDAYNDLSAYPYLKDALLDAEEGDTISVVKASPQKKVEIAAETEAIVPIGVTLQLPEGQTVYNSGTFVNMGEIEGGGSFSNANKCITSKSASFEDTITKIGVETIAYCYPIVYDLDGGEETGTNPKYYIIDSVLGVKINNPVKPGCIFAGWICDEGVSISDEGILTVSDDFRGDTVVLTANMPVAYDLWVGGVQVTSANKDDIVTAINDAAGINVASGTATYDPETSTLTLNNFSYTGEGTYCFDDMDATYGAIASQIELTIKLRGNNCITCTGTSGIHAGIAIVYKLVICDDPDASGMGELTVIGEYGIVGYGIDFTARSSVVKVTADSTAIYGFDSARIETSTLIAKGGYLAICNSLDEPINTYISNAKVFAGENESAAEAAGPVAIPDNNAYTDTAKYVKIVPVYTVTYMVGEDEVYTEKVERGKDVANVPELPAKEGYNETAPKWDKDGKNITADTVINAVYTINKYTVTYKADGKVVGTVEVEHGKDATAPEIPAKTGYTAAWSADGKNITADTEINAVYTVKKYTVTYKVDGEVIKTVEVEYGTDAIAPEIPAKVGHTAAWDKDGKNITADTEINAVYTINKYTVTYKADGKVVATVTVEYGKDATAPAIPAKEGYDETAPYWDADGKNITKDTTINAVYTKNQPGEYADVTPDTNVGGGKVTEEIEELKEKVPCTQEEEKQIEYGADVKVWLEIKDISASVPAEDKKEIEKKLGNADIAMYLDVSMFKQVGENEASRLTQLGDRVQICFKLADSLINTDKNVTRTYSIIRVHNGKAEIITPVFDAATKTLTFETDRFSTYAVVYTDVENVPPTQETVPPTEETVPPTEETVPPTEETVPPTEETVPPTEETVPPTEKPAPPADTPTTGDSSNVMLWATLLLMSAVAMVVLFVNRNRFMYKAKYVRK